MDSPEIPLQTFYRFITLTHEFENSLGEPPDRLSVRPGNFWGSKLQDQVLKILNHWLL